MRQRQSQFKLIADHLGRFLARATTMDAKEGTSSPSFETARDRNLPKALEFLAVASDDYAESAKRMLNPDSPMHERFVTAVEVSYREHEGITHDTRELARTYRILSIKE